MTNKKTTSGTTSTKNGIYRELPPELQEDDKGLSLGRVVVNIIHGFAMVAITLLTFRFFLLLFGASTSSSFVRFMYRSSEVVMAPFRGIFPITQIEDSVHYLDFSALFAIVAYALLAYWMSRLIKSWDRKDRIAEWEARQKLAQNTSPSVKENQ